MVLVLQVKYACLLCKCPCYCAIEVRSVRRCSAVRHTVSSIFAAFMPLHIVCSSKEPLDYSHTCQAYTLTLLPTARKTLIVGVDETVTCSHTCLAPSKSAHRACTRCINSALLSPQSAICSTPIVDKFSMQLSCIKFVSSLTPSTGHVYSPDWEHIYWTYRSPKHVRYW